MPQKYQVFYCETLSLLELLTMQQICSLVLPNNTLDGSNTLYFSPIPSYQHFKTVF